MARRPSRDEPIPLGKDAGTRFTRVWVTELAKFLRVNVGDLQKWADDRGILYRQGRGTGRAPAFYVTEQTAMRAIAHFRARQGGEYLKGRKYFEHLELFRRRRLRLKEAARGVGGVSPQIPLANPRAGTEDEALEAQAPTAE